MIYRLDLGSSVEQTCFTQVPICWNDKGVTLGLDDPVFRSEAFHKEMPPSEPDVQFSPQMSHEKNPGSLTVHQILVV